VIGVLCPCEVAARDPNHREINQGAEHKHRAEKSEYDERCCRLHRKQTSGRHGNCRRGCSSMTCGVKKRVLDQNANGATMEMVPVDVRRRTHPDEWIVPHCECDLVRQGYRRAVSQVVAETRRKETTEPICVLARLFGGDF
jgi:hypothetical protein